MDRAGSPIHATARALMVDRTTAEIVGALEDHDIPCVLLKGPAIHSWLYDDAAPRPYSDSDVLVPAPRADEAVAVLERIGFVETTVSGMPLLRPVHARELTRPSDRSNVDLHTTLSGAAAPPEDVWSAVSTGAELLRVGGRSVRVPSRGVLALIVTLHAAHHGIDEKRPLEDLRRAVAQADVETWRVAASAAAAVGALEAFGVGLALVPEGADLWARLRLTSARPGALVRLRAASAPDLAEGFAWLAAQRGLKRKLLFVCSRAFPPPAFMRRWSPLARRGRLGLLAAYAWRPLWLALHAPAGLRAWLKARR
ncbi:MAG TPA: nucleotidyltransferase family protein [Actinomycetota bacterium]|nr:nucleotidyltransferase family protein [Actinomycetota bacterium]